MTSYLHRGLFAVATAVSLSLALLLCLGSIPVHAGTDAAGVLPPPTPKVGGPHAAAVVHMDASESAVGGETTLLAFRTEIVDARLRLESSMVLDSSGNPHLAYEADRPDGQAELKVAVWTGSEWLFERIAGMNLGGAIAIALDSNGFAHISYSKCNPWYCEPVFVEQVFSQWVIDASIEGAGAIDVDANGDPHISYRGGSVVGELSQMYTHLSGGSWSTSTIETGLDDADHGSLKLDNQGRPHISYAADGDLKYAVWTGSQWVKQKIASGSYVDRHTSLALDADGQPHISYYDFDHGDLRYAHWNGSSWQTESVDAQGDVGMGSSMAVDSDGHPHIAYFDETNTTIKYAEWTGSKWRFLVVDDDGIGDQTISLALAKDDLPRIAYSSQVGQDVVLEFAWGITLTNVLHMPVILK